MSRRLLAQLTLCGFLPLATFNLAMSQTGIENLLPRNSLEIVIVVDNSYSMGKWQLNMASQLHPLLAYIGKSDWHITFITTDTKDLSSPRISAASSNYDTSFEQNVLQNKVGDAYERGLKKTQMLLDDMLDEKLCKPSSGNCEASKMAIIYITDEDEYTDSQTTAASLIKLLEFYQYRIGKDVRAYGFVAHTDVNCPPFASASDVIIDFIEQTQGKWYGVCQDDYTNSTLEISRDLKKMLAL